ncbi:tetratricopeptide repeat protein, partial [Myxococcota bacterium]|nr:tetratricopeptide repeat protein [Myxococcota bacterium]
DRSVQEQGDHRQALEHFDRAFQFWPDNPWARYSAALSAEQMGDFDRAADDYRYAIRIDGQATDARTRLARMLTAEGDAIAAVNFLVAQQPTAAASLDGLILLAELSARMNRFNEMHQTLLYVSQYGRRAYGKATAQVGQAIAETLEAKTALDYLETYGANRVANQDPTRLRAARKLIELRYALGQADLAQREIEALEAELPKDSAAAAALRGYALEQMKTEDAKARAAYEEALQADPRNPDALAGLGRIHATESPREAVAFFDRAIEAEPDNLESQRSVARLRRQLGETEQARIRLRQALATWPYSGQVALDLAELEREAAAPSTAVDPLIERAQRFRSELSPGEAARLDSLRVSQKP